MAEEKKYLGIWSWRLRWIIHIIPALPSTVIRYSRRNSINSILWIASEYVIPIKMKLVTHVLFFPPIVFKCSKLLRNQLMLSRDGFRKFVFKWKTGHIFTSLVFLECYIKKDLQNKKKNLNSIVKYRIRYKLAFGYNIS